MFNRLKDDIKSVFSRDPAARSFLEVLICYPGIHALIAHRVASRLWNANWKMLARLISQASRFVTGIEIHPGAKIGSRFFIDHGMGVVIGETARIGNDVTMYHGVTLGGTSFEQTIRHPQVGNHVIIGAGAQLLGPIKVGDNARIGSNAVVVTDVPEGATMVGVPAHTAESRKKRKLKEIDEGFCGYAVSKQGLPDPIVSEMQELAHHISVLQKRLQHLEKNLRQGEAETAGCWESETAHEMNTHSAHSKSSDKKQEGEHNA